MTTESKVDDQGRVIREVMFDDESGDVIRDLGRPPRKIRKTVKKKRRAKAAVQDDRIQLQIRVGTKLIENMDIAVSWLDYLKPDEKREESGGESRTSFATRAIQRRLDGMKDGTWKPGRTTADVLVGQRSPLLVRVPREMMAAMDEACTAAGVTRTVWALDAFLAELALVRKAINSAAEKAA